MVETNISVFLAGSPTLAVIIRMVFCLSTGTGHSQIWSQENETWFWHCSVCLVSLPLLQLVITISKDWFDFWIIISSGSGSSMRGSFFIYIRDPVNPISFFLYYISLSFSFHFLFLAQRSFHFSLTGTRFSLSSNTKSRGTWNTVINLLLEIWGLNMYF